MDEGGDYELGVNVHPWKSEAIEVGAMGEKEDLHHYDGCFRTCPR